MNCWPAAERIAVQLDTNLMIMAVTPRPAGHFVAFSSGADAASRHNCPGSLHDLSDPLTRQPEAGSDARQGLAGFVATSHLSVAARAVIVRPNFRRCFHRVRASIPAHHRLSYGTEERPVGTEIAAATLPTNRSGASSAPGPVGQTPSGYGRLVPMAEPGFGYQHCGRRDLSVVAVVCEMSPPSAALT
jgi:hypothetical protein